MYPISSIYEKYLRRLDQEWLVKAVINGVEYTNAEIVDFEIENSLALDEDFEIGMAILSKLTIRLRTLDSIPTNAKIVPYLGLSLSGMAWMDADIAWQNDSYPWTGGATEWLPLGEFFVDSRDKMQNVWVYTCYDKLVWADVPYISSLTYPTTMKAVWDEICGRLGYTYDSSVQINPSYMIQVGPAGYSMRQVMGYIAGANAASVFVGKDGTVKFRRFAAAEPAVFEMGQTDYIRVVQTNPIRTFSRVVVTYNTEDELTYEAGTGNDNQTLNYENPFMTQAMVNDLQATLNGFTYMPLTMDARGFPQIEAGDRISFARNESQAWDETFVAWKDMDLPWTGERYYQTIALHTVFTFRGGLRMSIEAMSKSEQQSEFVVEGTLTAAVNKLNKTAVKEGRPYYGATITRTEGFIVEREDHSSKVTLNSDKMAWEVGGLLKLYYDAQANKLKFTGDIEMEGGSINWTSVNPPSASDVGALPADSPKLSNLSDIGAYIGQLSQGQVDGLSQRLTKITSTGVYTGTVGTDQLIAGTALIGDALISSISANKINASSLSAISADLGSVTSGTLTGALIRTAASGTRIELSSSDNLLAAYYNSSYYIAINPLYGGGPAIQFFNGGNNVGNIYMSTNGIWIGGSTSNVVLNAQNVTVQGGWSQFGVPGQTMQAALNGKANTIHTHVISDVNGLQSALDSKASTSSVNSKASQSYVDTYCAQNMAFDPGTRNLKLYNGNGTVIATVNIP